MPPVPRRSMIGLLAGIGTAVVAASVGVTSPVSADTVPVITIGSDVLQVSPDASAQPVPKTLFGGNHRWVSNGLGMWDPRADAPAPGVVAAAEGAHLDMVRYPGGTIANMFDFTRAVGPQQARGCQTGAGFVGGLFEPVDSTYGPDENQRFVDTIGGETMVMVPTINQSAKAAADYVEYMNAPLGTNPNGGIAWAARRAANGHPAPYGIKVWEVGNEPYLPNQRYWRSTDAATKLTQFIEGGWQWQSADDAPYSHNDGLFSGCDLATPVTGNGQNDQVYRTRYRPIALAQDATPESGPIADPVLTVNGEPWQRVDSVHSSPKDAKVYEVARDSGEIRFGDGAHGAVPPAGAKFSIQYTAGRQDGFVDYYQAIKAVDPSVSVCAGWAKPEFTSAMGSRPYDCLGVHMYTSPVAGDTQTPKYDTEMLYHDLIRRGANAVDELTNRKDEIAANFPDPATRPFLAVTEYGTLVKNGPTGARMPQGYGAMLMMCLYNAELTIGQIENGAVLATKSNLNEGPPPPGKPSSPASVIGGAPNFFTTGVSQALNLVYPMVGSTPVVSRVSDNPTATRGTYPTLRVLGTRAADGTIRVLVINRDIQNPLTAHVDLAGLTGNHPVTVSTFNGPSVDSFDTYDNQDVLTTTVEQVTTSGNGLDHVFPAHSVTLLEVRPAA